MKGVSSGGGGSSKGLSEMPGYGYFQSIRSLLFHPAAYLSQSSFCKCQVYH